MIRFTCGIANKRFIATAEQWKPVNKFSLTAYAKLSKAKLSAFVVLTTMAGYAVAPGVTSLTQLAWTTLGTSMCVVSANAFNQWLEHPFDAQMARTKNRALVKRDLSPTHAFWFGAFTGIAGVVTLGGAVNGMTALLGLCNILLYAFVYTPMKRMSIWNTWVGAVVGALPPMMGWAAATGTLDLGAWVLGGLLFAWQFPHFNALSFHLVADYSKAGYHMLAVMDPRKNARVSLRYALALIPLCLAVPYVGMTTPWFLIGSGLLNVALVIPAFAFWQRNDKKSARKLFFVTLLYLPLLLSMLMVCKKESDQAAQSER